MQSSSPKILPQKMDENNCIDEFNELILCTYSKQIGLKILNMNKNTEEEGTSIDQTDDNNVGYNSFFFDNLAPYTSIWSPVAKKLNAITFVTETVEYTTRFHLTIKCKHIYRAVQMLLNMQKQTKSNSTGNTNLIRYRARMLGNSNLKQIMLQLNCP